MAKSPKGMRGGDGSERARLKDEVGVKRGFHRGQNPYIPLKPGVSGSGPDYPGNPECPTSTPDTPLPLNTASRFSRNLILNGFGRLLM
jgi:hypothetical protein